MMNTKQNIVILISGSGSNMRSIVQTAKRRDWSSRYNAHIAAVISNRAESAGLSWAQAQKIPTHVLDHKAFKSREAFDEKLAQLIENCEPTWVILAGFMRILSADFVSRFEGRLLNIHPSLLPAFTGLHTHERALKMGCRFTGATVHHVTSVLDEGPILGQIVVPILPNDTSDTLAARVLTQEHLLYPQVIEQLLASKSIQ